MERMPRSRFPQSRVFLMLSLTACLCIAGIAPGAADESLSELHMRHTIFQNMLGSQLMGDLVAYRLAAEQLGRRRIASGGATTLYQRTPGYLAPAAYASQQTDAVQREKAAVYYTQVLQNFENYATKNNLRLNDAADMRGLAFALAYEVYSGGGHVNAVQRNAYIRGLRSFFVSDPLFQGTSDKRRQLQTEKYGIDAALAFTDYSNALRTNDVALRDRAQQIAATILKDMWSGPVAGLELTSTGFGDRGERIIREGKATTRFVLSPTPIATDPQSAQLWGDFVRFAQSRGVAVNDLGQAQALALAISYKVYAGRDLNAQQFGWAVREMSHDALADLTWQGASDHEKQRSIETYAINAMMALTELRRSSQAAPEQFEGVFLAVAQSGGIDRASKARAGAESARQAAKKNLDQLFAPRVFDNYELVESGFQLRNGARR